jgi:hypothetical protein
MANVAVSVTSGNSVSISGILLSVITLSPISVSSEFPQPVSKAGAIIIIRSKDIKKPNFLPPQHN